MMKKALTGIYSVLLVIGLVLTIAAFLYAQNSLERRDGEKKEQTLVAPLEESELDGGVWEYAFSGSQFEGTNMCLAFYTVHHEVEVYEDGELIYALRTVDFVFGGTPGSGWNFVDVDSDAEEIIVRVASSYSQISSAGITFYKGGAQDIALNLIRGSTLEACVSLLDMAVGIFLVIYFFIVNSSMPIGKYVLHFGIFAVFMGIWSLNETTMAELLHTNAVAASFLAYISLMTMLAPFAMFIHEFLDAQDKWIMPAIVGASFVNMVVTVALHMTGTVRFRESVVGTHALMALVIVYFIYALAHYVRRNGWNRLAVVNVVGIGILAAAFSVDIVAFELALQHADLIGRFGFLTYIVLLAWLTASDSLKQLHEGQKAAIYKELAMKDMLTGLYSRNAYNEWEWEHKRPAGTAIVMFDLNNLKECNDEYGHTAGDTYLKKAAELIERCFGGIGKVYRIGGDEFCAVLEGAGRGEIEQQLKRLREAQERCNRTLAAQAVEIASGYAIFNENEDADFEAARNRADARMYENKRAIKNARAEK